MMIAAQTSCRSAGSEHRPSNGALVKDVVFAAVDVETTGFSPKKDRIVEVGVVTFKGAVIFSTNSWLINPGIPIPSQAVEVHGIDDALVADCRSFSDVWPEIRRCVGSNVVVMHNAMFDSRFLAAEVSRSGLTFWDGTTVDSLVLFRKWFPEQRSHSLGALAQSLGVARGIRLHRGLADALCLQQVFLRGMREHPTVRLGEIVR